MNKDIINRNNKNQQHGYQEVYNYYELHYRCNFKNNKAVGYAETHYYKRTCFYIK